MTQEHNAQSSSSWVTLRSWANRQEKWGHSTKWTPSCNTTISFLVLFLCWGKPIDQVHPWNSPAQGRSHRRMCWHWVGRSLRCNTTHPSVHTWGHGGLFSRLRRRGYTKEQRTTCCSGLEEEGKDLPNDKGKLPKYSGFPKKCSNFNIPPFLFPTVFATKKSLCWWEKERTQKVCPPPLPPRWWHVSGFWKKMLRNGLVWMERGGDVRITKEAGKRTVADQNLSCPPPSPLPHFWKPPSHFFRTSLSGYFPVLKRQFKPFSSSSSTQKLYSNSKKVG